MTVPTAIAIYFLIWWLTLFAVLPFGVRSQHEHGGEGFHQGTDPGAPILAKLGQKLIWTTIVSTVLFAIGAFVYVRKIVTFDDLARLFGLL